MRNLRMAWALGTLVAGCILFFAGKPLDLQFLLMLFLILFAIEDKGDKKS